jgi:hypothetical protein
MAAVERVRGGESGRHWGRPGLRNNRMLFHTRPSLRRETSGTQELQNLLFVFQELL